MNKIKSKLMMTLAMAALASNAKNGFGTSHKEVKPNPPKNQPKKLHLFTVKGVEIEAYSKKDAIKRYNHRNKR